MIKSLLLLIAGGAVGFAMGYALCVATYSAPPAQKVAQPIVSQAPRSETVLVGSVQTLFDMVENRPQSVAAVLLTMTGSVVELKNGTRLYVDTLERQSELGEAAEKAGLPLTIE